MRPVEDWRDVVSHSLSFWMQIAGLLVLILPELWFLLTGQDYDPYLAWWLGVLLLVGGLMGRLIDQPLSPGVERLRVFGVVVVIAALAFLLATQVQAAPASEQQTLDVAVPFVAGQEGERLVAYIPIQGDVPTIGLGHTAGVHMDMTITHQQAIAMLRADVADYRSRLHRYFTPPTIETRLPPTRDAAYTSTAYNCGVATIGRSTAVARLNAGNVIGGCQALTWFDKAGHRVIRGLFVRRQAEEKLCLVGAA